MWYALAALAGFLGGIFFVVLVLALGLLRVHFQDIRRKAQAGGNGGG